MPELNQYDYDMLVEKAEKLTKYENENWIAVERKVWELEREEHKQLKEDRQIQAENLVKLNDKNEKLKEIVEKIEKLSLHAVYNGNFDYDMGQILKVLATKE